MRLVNKIEKQIRKKESHMKLQSFYVIANVEFGEANLSFGNACG